MSAAGILLAAGRGTRMGADKLFLELRGRPVLAWALDAFAAATSIEQIVIATRADAVARVEAVARGAAAPVRVCVGGDRRRDSVLAGLGALTPEVAIAVVHDAARPLVTPAEIDEAVRQAYRHGAAAIGYPATDTIKRADATGRILETPPRHELWSVQTPQAFRVELLRRAHQATQDDATDDAALVERLDEPVFIYPGSRRNIKITTPEDLLLVEALLG